MVLVNGGKGIGTGFSYEGLCYNPTQIIQHLRWKLKGSKGDKPVIEPYYEGFKGTITKICDIKDSMDQSKVYKKYLIKGVYKIVGVDKIQITELPIGSWTDDYKKFLEALIEDTNTNKPKSKKKIIKNYIDMSTDTAIDITIRLVTGVMQKLLPKKSDYGCNQLEKALGMYTTRTTTNMNLFDSHQHLKKYINVYEIMDSYYVNRYNLFIKRKEHQLKVIEHQLIKISNRAKFIQEQIEEPPTLILRKKKKHEVIELLKQKNYDIINDDEEYKYLRTMPIDSVEEENVQKLLSELGDKKSAQDILKGETVEDIWLGELKELSTQYNNYRVARKHRASGVSSKKMKVKKVKIVKKIN